MTSSEIKIELIQLGKKQNDLIVALRENYNEKINPSEVSSIISGRQQGNKANRVLLEIERIINDWRYFNPHPREEGDNKKLQPNYRVNERICQDE